MELNTFSEDASRASTQEFPDMLHNQEIHYHIHNSLQLVPNLSLDL
jgi:hypothetical protein